MARVELAQSVEGEVELLTEAAALRDHSIPLGLTMARLGALLGASLVIGLTLASLGVLVLLTADALPTPVPSPYVTTGVAIMLAALLGGMAGTFVCASRTRAKLQRLRELLDDGHSVLLFDSPHDLTTLLRRAGAVGIGSLT